MFIYAGIDEAGYGPMFGPLVIARSVFAIDGQTPADPPNLWQLLKSTICRKPSDKRRRIAIDDSKKLFTPAAGLRHLERGLLAFAAAADLPCADLGQWLTSVGYDDDSCAAGSHLRWYHHQSANAVTLPLSLDGQLLHIARAQLVQTMARANVKLNHLKAAVVYEDRFNRMVQATRSKSRCEWTFVAGHILAIWQQFGRHKPLVVVDRQGGRTRYHDLLSLCLPDAKVHVLDESPECCKYELTEGERAMIVCFETQSEQRHLPVALASMTAKYTRELLMGRFNAFWQSHDPTLKPTAGYVTDGRRFLRDIQPLMQKLNISHDVLVRCK